MIGCHHSYQLWNKIHANNQSQIHAKSRQLRSELRNSTLGNRSIDEFMSHVKSISDSLASVGDPVSLREQLDVVLDALPSEYESFVTMVNMNTSFQNMDLSDVEPLLLAHEARVAKTKKASTDFSVNLTHSAPTTQSSTDSDTYKPEYSTPQQPATGYQSDSQSNSRNDRNNKGGGRGRGRGAIWCQVCNKRGHSVSIFFHR